MKRPNMSITELKKYVGKTVEIAFHNGETQKGILGFADEFSVKHDFRKPNYFYINNLSFKVSHIKKLHTGRETKNEH